MFTYLIYNMILVLSFLSAYLAEFSKTKFQRIVCRIVLFNILFIPAAIRYNVGTDYPNYVDYFNSVYGNDVNEYGFYVLTVFLRNIGLPVHSLFVASSFLSYFPLLFLSRRSYSIKILFYVLLLYLISLSAIRNAISISIVLLSFDLLFNGKVKKSLMIYPVSILFHTSALFFVPFFIVNRLDVNKKILLVFSVAVFVLSYFDVLFMFLLNSDWFYGTRYGRYVATSFFSETIFNTGYGMILKFLVPFYVLKRLLVVDYKNGSVYYLVIGYLLSIALAAKINIFGRVLEVFGIALIFAIPLYFACKKNNICIKYAILLFYVLLFQLFIRDNDGSSVYGDNGIYPFFSFLIK